MACHECIEIVASLLGIKRPRQFNSAQHPRTKINSGTLELVFKKPIVKTGIVGNEELAAEPFYQARRKRLKCWRIGHHILGDARQPLNEFRDTCLRIDQLTVSADPLLRYLHDTNLGDSITGCGSPRGLQINKDHRGRRLQCHPSRASRSIARESVSSFLAKQNRTVLFSTGS